MSGYIPFTDEQKEKARRTNLAGLLRSQGETLRKSGSELEWLDGSQKVTIRGNLWFHQYEQVGGDSIDFVRKFYHKSYPEAMEYLLGKSGGMLSVMPPVRKVMPKFELPPANDNMRRAFAYLLSRRGIDKDVLYPFVQKKMIFESAQYHNVVFVGFDKDGIPRHANKRGTGSVSTYKGNAVGSVPEYSFHWHGKSNRLYLFEAPIDMLSFISMNKNGWRDHSYAAACSVSDKVLFQCLSDNPNIDKVSICFDSDEPGQLAAQRPVLPIGVRQLFCQRLCLADRKPLLYDLLGQGPLVRFRGRRQNSPPMSGGQPPLLQKLQHHIGQLQQPQSVGNGGPGLAHPQGDILLGHAVLLQKALVALGLLNGVQVLPLEVFDQADLHDLPVVGLDDYGRDFL